MLTKEEVREAYLSCALTLKWQAITDALNTIIASRFDVEREQRMEAVLGQIWMRHRQLCDSNPEVSGQFTAVDIEWALSGDSNE